MNKRESKSVRLGGCDEAGNKKVPHTHYGLVRNLGTSEPNSIWGLWLSIKGFPMQQQPS